jgi:hypothetical protein
VIDSSLLPCFPKKPYRWESICRSFHCIKNINFGQKCHISQSQPSVFPPTTQQMTVLYITGSWSFRVLLFPSSDITTAQSLLLTSLSGFLAPALMDRTRTPRVRGQSPFSPPGYSWPTSAPSLSPILAWDFWETPRETYVWKTLHSEPSWADWHQSQTPRKRNPTVNHVLMQPIPGPGRASSTVRYQTDWPCDFGSIWHLEKQILHFLWGLQKPGWGVGGRDSWCTQHHRKLPPLPLFMEFT